MSAGAARTWWRVVLVADLALVLLAWAALIGFMRAPFWTREPQHHPWGDYARASALVLGPGLAIVAAATGAGWWLGRRGWRRLGVATAALPLEGTFLFVAQTWPL